MLTLVGRSIDRIRVLFAALVAVIVVLQVLLVRVAATFERSGSFERILALVPSFLTRSFASSFLSLASFRAMAIAGYFHPAVVLMLTEFSIYLASEPAGDVELGHVDLVLARPLARHRVMTRSLVVTGLATTAVVVAMGVATGIGLTLIAPAGASWPAPRTILVLSVELLLVAWCFGAVTLAAAAFVRRRATAISFVGMIAIALYLLEFLGASWPAAAPYARVSPFHYYQGMSILVGQGDVTRDVAVLLSAAGAAVALAYWQFARRDL